MKQYQHGEVALNELTNEVMAQVMETLRKEVSPIVEDTLNNFEERIVNNIRFEEEGERENELSDSRSSEVEVDVLYNENSFLELVSIQEMAVEKFEEDTEIVVMTSMRDAVREILRRVELT